MRLVALLVGPPQAVELWTLRRLAACSELHVLQARQGTTIPAAKRLRRLVRAHGARAVVSRLLAERLIGQRERRRQQLLFEELFDGEALRDWWKVSGITPVDVLALNHGETREAIVGLEPDIIVRVSGGILKPEIFTLARLGALNIHHGRAPQIRGMWSIPWGIVEGRPEWIGATVHLIDEGIDTGSVLWCGAPQLAPGDTGDTLFFRAHLEAVEALVGVIESFAAGRAPAPIVDMEAAASVYRSAPGLGAWLRYLRLGRGSKSPALIRQAIEC